MLCVHTHLYTCGVKGQLRSQFSPAMCIWGLNLDWPHSHTITISTNFKIPGQNQSEKVVSALKQISRVMCMCGGTSLCLERGSERMGVWEQRKQTTNWGSKLEACAPWRQISSLLSLCSTFPLIYFLWDLQTALFTFCLRQFSKQLPLAILKNSLDAHHQSISPVFYFTY